VLAITAAARSPICLRIDASLSWKALVYLSRTFLQAEKRLLSVTASLFDHDLL
jgi:hypothetical protein